MTDNRSVVFVDHAVAIAHDDDVLIVSGYLFETTIGVVWVFEH